MCHDQAKTVSARDFDGPMKPYEPGAVEQARQAIAKLEQENGRLRRELHQTQTALAKFAVVAADRLPNLTNLI